MAPSKRSARRRSEDDGGTRDSVSSSLSEAIDAIRTFFVGPPSVPLAVDLGGRPAFLLGCSMAEGARGSRALLGTARRGRVFEGPASPIVPVVMGVGSSLGGKNS